MFIGLPYGFPSFSFEFSMRVDGVPMFVCHMTVYDCFVACPIICQLFVAYSFPMSVEVVPMLFSS